MESAAPIKVPLSSKQIEDGALEADLAFNIVVSDTLCHRRAGRYGEPI
jgi:hypothetical protein